MVISFSNDQAFEHLVEQGYVTTFRPNRRKNRYGENWVNRGRGEEKEFDCHIAEIGKVVFGEDEQTMHRVAGASGFGSSPIWKHAIQEIHGELPDQGWIYLVKKR